MFGGGASNPYDDIVAKTTDENLTSENWELILNLCDKVADEKDEGAHNVIAALLKRLAHRNPNVQLYALSLGDALSKNCGLLVNKELASRAFTQGLEKIVMDRTTHDKVRKRTLALIAQWSGEFENDTSLGVMEDCYNNLKAKGYKFDTQQEPLPPTVDDEIRRKEEEELQRVLEMSMQDRGGRDQWAQYSLSATSGAGGSSSGAGASSSSKPSGSGAAGSSSAGGYAGAPKYQGGYVPARTPSPQPPQSQPQQPQPRQEPRQEQQQQQPQIQTQTHDYAQAHSAAYAQAHSNISATSVSSPSASASGTTTTNPIVTRVRALHAFEPTEPGELAFEKGDIIKVVDRGYKDWWRGQLKGRTGIFPVNYVEPMPEPTANELAREAEQEAAVFSQAVNVEKLLNMLRAFDPAKDNLADNEEIQELYRSSMALRPKIVKLIDKYSQKRADLVSMNETFVRARTIFDRMMEESLARHTGLYDSPQGPYRPAYGATPGPGIPDSRARVQPGGRDYVTSPAGGAPGYPGYAAVQVPQGFPEPQPTPTPASNLPGSMGYPAPGPAAAPATPGAYGYAPGPQPQPQPQPQQQSQPQPQPQPLQANYSQLANAPYSAQGPTPYPAAAAAAQLSQQPQIQPLQPQLQQLQPQPQTQQPVVGQQQPAQGQYGQNPYQAGSQPGYDYDATAPGQAQYQALGQTQVQPQQAQHAQQLPQVQPQPQPVQQHQVQPQQQPVQQHQVQPQQQPVQQHQVQPQQQPVQQQQVQQPVQQQQVQQPVQQQQVQPVQQPAQQQDQPHQQPAQQQQQPIEQQQQQPTQASQQHQPSTQSGPPYVFDPNTTYTDPNVQAWAHYYSMGGRDLAGSVYFVSIPGLTDGSPSGADATTPTGGAGGQAQPQAHGGQQNHGAQGGNQHQQQHHQQQDPSSLDQETYTAQQQPSNPYFDGSALNAPQQQQPNNGSSTSLGSNSHSFGPTTLAATSPGASATGGYGTSPSTAASTPSWVLPKKGAGQGAGDVQGLSGRFGGVSLTDRGMVE